MFVYSSGPMSGTCHPLCNVRKGVVLECSVRHHRGKETTLFSSEFL